MSELAWTVNFSVTKQDIHDIMEIMGEDDNPAIALADAIIDLPEGEDLLLALDALTDLTRKVDDWCDNSGFTYECDEGIEALMKELDTYEHLGAAIAPHTNLRMRLLLEELNALFAFYDMEPLRTRIDIFKQELRKPSV